MVPELRSNSAGAVYSLCDPAEIFGSAIFDQLPKEEKSLCQMIRSTTIPSANNKKEYIQEISLVAQGPPFKPTIKVVLDEKDAAKAQHEFGKSMHEYAKKNLNSKEIPASKSEGNLQSKKLLNNHHLNKAHHHHHQHQCCSGFGSGSRHRSNACVIN